MNSTAGEPQRDRAREADRLRYMFPQLRRFLLRLDSKPRDADLEAELARWTVRGEPRTRATFAAPHPGDFPGGLPLPPEYPRPLCWQG